MKYLLALVLCLAAFSAHAGSLTLSWTPPTTCEGGAPLTECPTSGYEILEGATPTGTFTSRETVAASVTQKTYTGLAPGQRCFSLKTISVSEKSAESNRACATVPSLPPKAPMGITVKVEVTVTTP